MSTDEIYEGHPYLAQVSSNPVTLQGYLVVTKKTWMRIKITLPNYPSLKDMCVRFGEQIALTRNANFPARFAALKEKCPSLLTFLDRLKSLLASIIVDQETTKVVDVDALKTLLENLKAVLTIPDITVFANKELTVIKLEYNGICMSLEYNSTGSKRWTVMSSDLPRIKDWTPRESNTLSEAAQKLKTVADKLEQTWLHLQDIDRNCCVIEPVNPKPYHLHRRIFLNPALSLLLTLDPKNNNHPEMTFYGSDAEIAKHQATITASYSQWSEERSATENLLTILKLDTMPKRASNNDSSQNNDRGVLSVSECGICFDVKTDNEEYTSKVCNNTKCQKNFHVSCLSRWLQGDVRNAISFDKIYGDCPYCKEHISCSVSN